MGSRVLRAPFGEELGTEGGRTVRGGQDCGLLGFLTLRSHVIVYFFTVAQVVGHDRVEVGEFEVRVVTLDVFGSFTLVKLFDQVLEEDATAFKMNIPCFILDEGDALGEDSRHGLQGSTGSQIYQLIRFISA
jgi:hypothetical protein